LYSEEESDLIGGMQPDVNFTLPVMRRKVVCLAHSIALSSGGTRDVSFAWIACRRAMLVT
jgi:hypothetical protein